MATATYTAQAKKFGRRVQWLVEMDLDRCNNVYTQAPCTASDAGDGSRCHYSFGTCQDVANFVKTTRTYRFCRTDVPWTDNATLCWPLLAQAVVVPQEIKASNLATFPEQVKAVFNLDYSPLPMDIDKGTNFYNTSTAGEFFKNLIARNRNYSGRPFRIKRGFSVASGFVLADFEQIGPDYLIRSIKVEGNRATVTAESPLVELEKKQTPWTLSEDNKLTTAIVDTGATTTVVMNDTSELPDPADYTRNEIYIEIEDSTEIMQVTSIDSATNLTVVREAFGTTGTTHSAGKKISHIACFGNTDGTSYNVTEGLQDLLEWAGIASGKVTTASFTRVQNSAWPSDDVTRIIRKPKKISKLVQEIRDVRGIVLYVDTDGNFAVNVMAPNIDGAVLDDDSLLDGSVVVTEDDEQRVTRVSHYYDPIEDNAKEPEDFVKKVVVINTDLEQANNFNDERDHQILDHWTDPDLIVAKVRNTARRFITRNAYGVRTIAFALDVKDEVNVGDTRTLETRHITDTLGNVDARPVLILSKREKGRSQIAYEAIDTNFGGRYLRFGPDTMAATYDTGSSSDKSYGYHADDDNRVGVKFEQGYIYW